MQILAEIISNGPAGGSIKADTIGGFRVTLTDLPDLTGTPKQIEWAEKIRWNALDERGHSLINNATCETGLISRATLSSPGVITALEKINATLARLADKLADKTEASAWIEAKKDGPVLRMITRA